MKIQPTRPAAAAALIGLLVGCTREPPPDLGPDFPAAPGSLERMNAAKDYDGIRAHGWSVFKGLTRGAKGEGLPWESWPSAGDMLDDQSAPSRRIHLRAFPGRRRPPTAADVAPADQACEDVADTYPTLVSVRFSPSAMEHVVDHGYQRAKVLTAMEGRCASISEFPRGAVAIKAVWWPVKPGELTPMPVWTGPSASKSPSGDCFGNSYLRWPRIIAIDATPGVPAAERDGVRVKVWWRSKKDPFTDPPEEIKPKGIVPLGEFYSRALTETDLKDRAEFDPTFEAVLGRPAKVDDLVVLVGFHFSTKETPDWFWGTVWWSDVEVDADQPRELAKDPVWKHFRLSATVDVWRRDPFHVQPIYAFNPWLEGRFEGGTVSNCIDCHQRAVWKLGMTPDFRVPPYLVRFDHDDPAFACKVRLDYMWSLTRERPTAPVAGPSPPEPGPPDR